MKLFVLDGGWRGGFAVIAADGIEARRLADAAAEVEYQRCGDEYLLEVLSRVDEGLIAWEVFEPGKIATLSGDK